MHNQRSPLLFIFLTIFLDLLGAGMILPLLPYYVKLIQEADSPWIMANLALIVGMLTAAFSFFQFLFTPMLGALSDRVGRRPVLLVSLAGTGIAYLLLGVADQFVSFGALVFLGVLFFARMLDGITGGNISTAQAYIADVTPPEERARGMGLIGAAFGLGFMLGPAFGGLLSTISLSTPAFVAAALTFANVVFGFFKLPESLPRERRVATPLRQMNPFVRLQGVLGRTNIRPLLLGSLLLNLAFAGLQSNFAVFSAVRFGYGPLEIAFLFAFIGAIAVVVQGFLIRRLVPRFGEARLAVTGFILMTLAFAVVAVAPAAWMLYPAMALLASGSGLATPSITSLISRRVAAQEQGSVLGGVQSLTSLTMVVGPLFAGAVFDAFGPASPYIAGVVLLGCGLIVLALALRADLRPTAVRQPVSVAGDIETVGHAG